jgi:hypothetical protein
MVLAREKLTGLLMKQKLLFGFWIFPFPLSSRMIVNLKHKFSLDNKVIAGTGYIGLTACSYVYRETMD